MPSSPSVNFGPFRLCGRAGPLLRDGTEVRLRSKALEVLWLLVSKPGEAIDKETLISLAWPNLSVADSGLAVCISEIRDALGDSARKPRYVQTMHRHGYRFVGRLNMTGSARQSSFVGRTAEFEKLDRELDAVGSGMRRLVLLNGNPGVGKSALIEAWCGSVSASDQARLTRGRCTDQSGATEAYLPFINALRHLSAGADGDEIRETMRALAPSWLLQFSDMISSEVREELEARFGTTDVKSMRREFADFLAALSADKPLVLVLEDMHWCDPSSAAMLGMLLRDTAFARLLILVSYRRMHVLDEIVPLAPVLSELQLHRQSFEVGLGPLSEAEVAAYLSARFENPDDTAFASSIFDRTEGHPLFMVALSDHIAALREGALSGDAAYFDNGPPPRDVVDQLVPRDIVTFIELRIAGLQQAERRVIEAASVAGNSFTVVEVESAAALGDDDNSVERICESLCRRHEFLVEADLEKWPDGTLTSRYAFRHALYPEVIRGTIPNLRRARLHQAVGTCLERGYGTETSAIARLLAHHFENSHDVGRAINYLMQSAALAVTRHAHVEATQLLRRGLALVEEITAFEERCALELNLLLTLGPTLIAQEGYGSTAVEEIFTRARMLSGEPALGEHRFPVLRGLAAFYILQADYRTAQELSGELLSIRPSSTAMPGNPQDGPLVEGSLMGGVAKFFRGDFAAAETELVRSISVYDRVRHADHAHIHGLDPGSLALSFAALTRWLLNSDSEAVARIESALDTAKAVDHTFSLAQCHAMAALLHQWRGDVEQTRLHSDMASELAIRHGFPYLVASEQARRGWIRAQSGDAANGIRDIREGVSLYRSTGALGGLTAIMATQVEAHLISGQIEAGLQVAEEALALSNDNSEGFYKAELLRLQGELLRRTSGRAALSLAEKGFRASLDLANFQGVEIWKARAAASLAELNAGKVSSQ